MIGIPYRLLRHGEDGPVDKMIYLATRRSGEAGAAMRKAKRDFQKHEFAGGKATLRFKAESLVENPNEEKIVKLLEEIQEAGEAGNDAAEKLVLLSLTENYGKETATEILDLLTNRDIRTILSVLETGELPKDFFGSNGQPLKPTSTLPPGDSPREPSLATDTQSGKSAGEK